MEFQPPAKSLKTKSSSSPLETSCAVIQEFLLATLVAPFLPDRRSFNNLSSTSREIYEVCKDLPAPWPGRTHRLGAVVQSIAFSSTGHLLACSSGETIHLWNRQTGKKDAINTGMHITCVAFSPEGEYLVSGHRATSSAHQDFVLTDSPSNSVKLWNTQTLKCAQNIGSDQFTVRSVLSVAFSPNGETIAVGGIDESVRIFRTSDGALQETFLNECGWTYQLAFSPEGAFLAYTGESKEVAIIQMQTGEKKILRGHSETVHSLAFTHDGTILATGSDDESIMLWGMSNHFEPKRIEGIGCSVWAVAFAPDGNTIASGGQDVQGNPVIKLYSIKDSQQIAVLKGHTNFITALAFSPSGRTLASGAFDSTMRTWNVASEIHAGRGNQSNAPSGLEERQ